MKICYKNFENNGLSMNKAITKIKFKNFNNNNQITLYHFQLITNTEIQSLK
jgi:hypothetical protein